MKIGERGQVTIPKPLRERFGFTPATEVEFVEKTGVLTLKKAGAGPHPIRKYVGVLKAKRMRTDELIEAMRGR